MRRRSEKSKKEKVKRWAQREHRDFSSAPRDRNDREGLCVVEADLIPEGASYKREGAGAGWEGRVWRHKDNSAMGESIEWAELECGES